MQHFDAGQAAFADLPKKRGNERVRAGRFRKDARLSDASRLTDAAGFRGECLAVGAYNEIYPTKKGCTLMCILSRSALFFHPETGFQKLSPQPAHKEGGVR